VWPDVSNAKELLGWEATIGVREGIAQSINWLRELDATSAPRP
jgi:nucleoside-diphosphate-sugar epimerase